MRVLVTGGLGFLGRYVVAELLKRGHEPTILDNESTGDLETPIPEGLEYLTGNLRVLTCRYENIIHLACRYPLERDAATWTEAYHGYVGDLFEFLKTRMRSTRRVVVGSTLDVWAPSNHRGSFGTVAASMRDLLTYWHRPPAPSFVMVHMPELFGRGRLAPSALWTVPGTSPYDVPRRPYFPDVAPVGAVAAVMVDRLEAPPRISIDWTVRGSSYEDTPLETIPTDQQLHLSPEAISALYSDPEG